MKFVDLFAGIGGFHVALKSIGMTCVLACEIDKFARQTYLENFDDSFLKKETLFPEDIWSVDFNKMPNFDVLCAGFPCQPFSQVGQKKGFKDNKSGNLFFAIEDILKIKRPLGYILENVQHLRNHDGGKTLKTIAKKIRDLDYTFDYKILRASDYGLPTHRPRIFMVGFDKNRLDKQFHELPVQFPDKKKLKKTMSDIMNGKCSTDFDGKEERVIGFTLRVGGAGSGVKDRRNWDSYIVNKKEVRITPEQGLQMMGFPKGFKFPGSRRQSLKQLGNSVAVDVVREVGKAFIEYYKNYKK